GLSGARASSGVLGFSARLERPALIGHTMKVNAEGLNPRVHREGSWVHFTLLTSLLLASPLHAQVYEKVFSFTEARATDIANTPNKGAAPSAVLVQGSDGSFYGTTRDGGGANGQGTVFKMTPSGMCTTLVVFTGIGESNKGSQPVAGLVQGSDGSFYGTTRFGGANFGTVFKMTPSGVLTTLVEFTFHGTSNKGSVPSAGLVQGSDGNFYGTTLGGGANNFGTVFKMTPSGVLTTLVEFTGNGTSNKGREPTGLGQGSDGSFYGTTQKGGANDSGTVFKMTPSGVLTTLVEFTGNGTSNKGSQPVAGLVQ